jgi:hypothetical protein
MDVRRVSKQEFKDAVAMLIFVEVYPSPANIRRQLGLDPHHKYHHLNGRQCKWREEVFAERGWEHKPDGVEGHRKRRWGPKG